MPNLFRTTGSRVTVFAPVLCLLAGAAGTAQAQTQNFTDPQFVTANYFAVLGRAPDWTGWNFWYYELDPTQQGVQSVGRTGVSNGLISSPEYYTKCQSKLPGTPNYYYAVYTVGSSQLAEALTAGTYTTSPPSCPSSTSYQSGWFPQSADFVTMLYLEGLGREPDTGGWIYWYCGLVPSLACSNLYDSPWPYSAITQAQTVGEFVASGTEFVNDYGVSNTVTPGTATISGTGVGSGVWQTVSIPYTSCVGRTCGVSGVGSGNVFVGTGNATVWGSTLTGCQVEWSAGQGVALYELYNGSAPGFIGTLGATGTLGGTLVCSLNLAQSLYNPSTGTLTLALNYLPTMSGQQTVYSYGADTQGWPTLPGISVGTFAILGPPTNVTLATSPAGLSLTAGTAACVSTPCTYSWTSGSSQMIAAPSPQQMSGLTYAFSGWSDGGDPLHSITVPSSATTYTATFAQTNVTLALASPPGPVLVGRSVSASFNVVGPASTSISFTASGMPAYTSYSTATSPSPCVGSCTLTVYFSPVAGALTGNYPITITGTGGVGSGAVQTTLVVRDFAVAISPAQQLVTCGQTATATVQVTGLNGFSDYFSLAVQWSGIYPGAAPTFSPSNSLTTTAASGTPLTITMPTNSTCYGYPNDTQFWVSVSAYSDSQGVSHSTTAYIVGDDAPSVSYVIQSSIQPSPAGISIVVDGSGFVNSHAFAWPSNGAFHTFSVASPQVVNGATYVFVNWSDGSTLQTRTIAVGPGSSPATYTANFSTSAADFTIRAVPQSPSQPLPIVSAGGAATYQVTLNPVNGYSGSVSLSNWQPPAGVSVTLGPTASAGQPASLTISTPAGMRAGWFAIPLAATDGTRTRYTAALFCVDDCPWGSDTPVIGGVTESTDGMSLDVWGQNLGDGSGFNWAYMTPNPTGCVPVDLEDPSDIPFSCSGPVPQGTYTFYVTVCDLPDYGGECLSDEAEFDLPGPEASATVAMQLQLIGTVISTDGNYSEDSTIQVTAVDANTGQTLTNFTGTVNIAESGTAIYSQNGGALQPSVTISAGGSATTLARSLAGPKASGAGGSPPDPAVIITTNYPLYQGASLFVPQWIITEIIDPLADLSSPDDEQLPGPTVYNWLQARIHDMYGSAKINDQVLFSVLSLVLGYGTDGSLVPGAQTTPPSYGAPESGFMINPFYTSYRLDSGGLGLCNAPAVTHELHNTVAHEARHSYQFSLDNATLYPGNDNDRDILPANIYIAPLNIWLDPTPAVPPTQTPICNEYTNEVRQFAFSGPEIFDPWGGLGTPGTGAGGVPGVSWAAEMDAWTFASQH